MNTKLTEAARLALEALKDTLSGDLTPYQAAKTITAIRAALEQPAQGCDYCNHPQYAGIKCKNCGRMTEQPAQQMTIKAYSEISDAEWEQIMKQPAQDEPVDCEEKASAYMEARLWEFIDMAAAWPKASPDPRTWSNVMVYAPKPAQQEPVAWNVIDPTGKIVATEVNAIRGWARIQGYKPTVEALLAFHEQGWRVVSTLRPQAREPLTDEEISKIVTASTGWQVPQSSHYSLARAIEIAHNIGKKK